MHIERTIDIEAPASVVWAVMADVEQWHTWTDSIASVQLSGPGRADETVGVGSTAEVRQPGFPAATWTVTAWEPGRSFTWESRAPGVHSIGEHSVVALDQGTSRVTLAIHQTGALAWILGLLAGKRSRRYVDMEATGLKARAEELAVPGRPTVS